MVGTPPVLEEDAEAAWELLVFGVEEMPPPTQGDAESAAWFRAQLQELGFTQGTFARFMQRRGDVRSKRNIQRMCAGQVRVPGEMRVLLGLMLRSKKRKMAKVARDRDERDAPWNDPPEPRHAPEKRDAHEASASGLSETRHGQDERGGCGTSGNDLSETRHRPEEQDAQELPRGSLPEAPHGQEERGAGEAPGGHSSEKRHGPEE